MCVLKLVISIVNSLLMMIGIVLAVIGALLLWRMNFFMKNIYDIEAQFKNFITKIRISSASSGGIFSLMQQNANSIGAIAFGVGIALIALAILGIVAVRCCSLKKILIVLTERPFSRFYLGFGVACRFRRFCGPRVLRLEENTTIPLT